MFPREYKQVSGSEEGLPPEGGYREATSWSRLLPSKSFPWICSTVLLLFLLGAQSYYYRSFGRSGTYETGFVTDFGPISSAIDLIEVEFSGNLEYTETGHLYINLGADGVRYFGDPAPEVDQAWASFLGEHSTFPMSQEDAEALRTSSKPAPEMPAWVGPDVLHTLHCVNEVRKVLDSEYYYNSTLRNLKRLQRLHIDHCLNHIRQVIACHMDLTPGPSMYFESVDTYVANFHQVHTCRDLSKLREWMVERRLQPSSFKDNSHSRHGYFDNTADALLPWGSTESEFE